MQSGIERPGLHLGIEGPVPPFVAAEVAEAETEIAVDDTRAAFAWEPWPRPPEPAVSAFAGLRLPRYAEDVVVRLPSGTDIQLLAVGSSVKTRSPVEILDSIHAARCAQWVPEFTTWAFEVELQRIGIIWVIATPPTLPPPANPVPWMEVPDELVKRAKLQSSP